MIGSMANSRKMWIEDTVPLGDGGSHGKIYVTA